MQVPSVKLNDGHAIPQLGFGTWRLDDAAAKREVAFALRAGYRHIDTASVYRNEQGVGQGLRGSGLPRGEIFLTSKVYNTEQGYDKTLAACEESLKRLNTDYLDLYLIHWPCPGLGLYVETWKALIHLREQGLVRSIGVSNFTIADLERLFSEAGITPAVNQIELHPHFQQAALRAFHKQHHIATESWSPLGRGDAFEEPAIKQIAAAHGRSPAQIILRWQMELGNIAIPKSATDSRIIENFRIFDFRLSEADHIAIAALDKADGRRGHDPLTYNG